MNIVLAASLGDTITDAVAEVASALRYPVLILALLALAVVTYEFGRLVVEAFQRSQRTKERFDNLARHALQLARSGDSAGAQAVLRSYAYGGHLQRAAVATLFASSPVDAQRAVIDYDLHISKRLDRVRLLVRSGPALGLMGTLIPLAPALAALGDGDSKVLADELQTAFAITVVGVAIGLIAFTVALVHERFFTKDLADLEFLREIRGDATTIAPATAPQPAAATPAHVTATDQPEAATAAQTAVTSAVRTSAPGSAYVAPPAAAPSPYSAAEQERKKKFGVKRKQRGAGQAAPPAPVF
ncbi:MAG: MotA/TolQ/ExbB proton channel family protein, partial [Solirubrobacterales bacterium]